MSRSDVSESETVLDLVTKARETLARTDLPPDLRTRLDAARLRLMATAGELNELCASAEWVSTPQPPPDRQPTVRGTGQ